MKKDQNKKKKRKVLLSLIMILFVGVILTASTYTWFTANKTVTVESLDVNVSTSSGLQISTNAVDWKTTITRADITGARTKYAAATNQVPNGQTNPVSSAGEVDTTTGFLNMYRGLLTSEEGQQNLTLTAVKSTETNGTEGDFIAFDLFFNTNEAQDIYLTSGSNVVGGKADAGQGTDTSIQNAARVAFIPQGTNPEASDSAASQALKNADTANMKIWEPNADTHTANGVNNAVNYGQANGLQAGEGNAVLSYYGIKAAIGGDVAQEVNSQDPAYFAAVDASKGLFTTSKSGIPTTAYQQILHLEKGVTKVRIYMWVEGQDVDCEDYASGGDLTYNLQFSSLSAQA